MAQEYTLSNSGIMSVGPNGEYIIQDKFGIHRFQNYQVAVRYFNNTITQQEFGRIPNKSAYLKRLTTPYASITQNSKDGGFIINAFVDGKNQTYEFAFNSFDTAIGFLNNNLTPSQFNDMTQDQKFGYLRKLWQDPEQYQQFVSDLTKSSFGVEDSPNLVEPTNSPEEVAEQTDSSPASEEVANGASVSEEPLASDIGGPGEWKLEKYEYVDRGVKITNRHIEDLLALKNKFIEIDGELNTEGVFYGPIADSSAEGYSELDNIIGDLTAKYTSFSDQLLNYKKATKTLEEESEQAKSEVIQNHKDVIN